MKRRQATKRPHRPHAKARNATRRPSYPAILAADPAPATEHPFSEGAGDSLDPDLRHRLISETAFHHLEDRGFAEGSEVEDWSEAEAEVDHTLIEPSRGGG